MRVVKIRFRGHFAVVGFFDLLNKWSLVPQNILKLKNFGIAFWVWTLRKEGILWWLDIIFAINAYHFLTGLTRLVVKWNFLAANAL